MAEQRPPASGGEEASPQHEMDPPPPASGAGPEVDPLAAVADDLDAAPALSSDDQAAIDELLKQATFDDPSSMAAAAASVGAAPSAAAAVVVAGATAGAAAAPAPVATPPTASFDLPSFTQALGDASTSSIDLLRDVDLNVKIELGRARMLVEDVLKLGEGSVVELDKLAGDPVDVFVNDRLVARGEVLVLNDNFCVRINEIVAGVKEEGL